MKKKKKFRDCGHTGFGQYCHYCKQLADKKIPIVPNSYITVEGSLDDIILFAENSTQEVKE